MLPQEGVVVQKLFRNLNGAKYKLTILYCCSKEAFVFLESVKEEEWMRAVGGHLHPLASYSLVRHVRLVGMLLIIYARHGILFQLYPFVVEVKPCV